MNGRMCPRIRNAKCGLLHCAGGAAKPVVGHNQTFSKTVVHDGGRQYECKWVDVLMVRSDQCDP